MNTYRVMLTTGASTVITVEANSEDEAEEKAWDELPYVCAQCSGWGRRPGIEIGDWETESIDEVQP